MPNRIANSDKPFATLTDVQRRGEKVLNECDKLYDYAVNGTENYRDAIANVETVGSFVSDGNNMVQTLKLTANKEIGEYDIKLTDFPNGTTYTKNGSTIKVIVPKANITGDIKGLVSIQNAQVKTCPAFYGQSYNDNWQDYVTVADPYEVANTKATVTFKTNDCNIQITKIDSETKEVIPNTTLKIEKDGKEIKTVTTNEKGIATVQNLYPGTYKITEIKANPNYVVPTNASQTVTIKYGDTAKVTFNNTHKKGNLKVLKVDKDNHNITLGGVEFDLINSSGKIVSHLVTNANGIAEVKNINTDNYILKETKTKNEYKLALDQDVTIKWNETFELKVENEKRKGQIKIIKVDRENNEVKLEGVQFQIIDENNYVIETVKTNKEGIATTSKIPIGTYKIKEVSLGTNEEYILSDAIKTITVEENKIKAIQFENDRKKGNLKIYKVDLDNNEIPVPDVEFEIIDQDGYKYTAVSDKNGIAYIENIRTGIATIKETKTNKIYKLNNETYSAEIKWNETLEITIENEKLKGEIEVFKVDAEDNEIKLEGVEFEVINSDNVVVETIKTDKNGYCKTSRLPIGEYTLKEVKTDNMHILNEELIRVDVTTNIVSTLEITNERIKGQIKIVKTSEGDNFINGEKAGTPIQNVEFEVYNSNKELVDTITTDKEGIAITKKLDKGNYTIKEVKSGKWYLLNENVYNVDIIDGTMANIEITNESVEIDIEIQKKGFIETQSKDNIFYNFSNIKNKSNVPLDNFTWRDTLPTEAVRIDKIYTGTWNENLNYAVYYKTNKSDKYILFKDKLNTQKVYELNFNELKLAEDEYVTEYEFRFGTVKVGFQEVESPILYCNMLNGLGNGFVFTNNTKVSGTYYDAYVEDTDDWTTITYYKEIEIEEVLPRTR